MASIATMSSVLEGEEILLTMLSSIPSAPARKRDVQVAFFDSELQLQQTFFLKLISFRRLARTRGNSAGHFVPAPQFKK